MNRAALLIRSTFLPALALGLVFLVPGAAIAAIAQGYQASSDVQLGHLVSVDERNPKKVVPASRNNPQRLLGVAVAPGATQLSLSSSSKDEIHVATDGVVPALVSTARGDIKKGDPITVSRIAGVGRKATGPSRVVGTAEEDLNANTPGAVRRMFTDEKGQKEIVVAPIDIRIAVSDFGGQRPAPDSVTEVLTAAGAAVTGRPVAPARAIAATLIFLVGTASTTVLLYSAVRNSIIAIGRNPLARTAVYRSLAQVTGVALLLLGVSAGVAYGILR